MKILSILYSELHIIRRGPWFHSETERHKKSRYLTAAAAAAEEGDGNRAKTK